jgi:hypothetical protein
MELQNTPKEEGEAKKDRPPCEKKFLRRLRLATREMLRRQSVRSHQTRTWALQLVARQQLTSSCERSANNVQLQNWRTDNISLQNTDIPARWSLLTNPRVGHVTRECMVQMLCPVVSHGCIMCLAASECVWHAC